MIENLRRVLEGVWIAPFRLWLETTQSCSTVPMLRGVLGHAIMDVDPYCFEAVFRPRPIDGTSTPRFLLRPAPSDPHVQPAMDYFLLGSGVGHAATLWKCWDRACQLGLGPANDRHPFRIRQIFQLGPSGHVVPSDREPHQWNLGDAVWLANEDSSIGVSLSFPSPTRLRGGPDNKRSSFIDQPTLSDVVVAVLRRIESLHIEPFAVDWRKLREEALAFATRIDCRWEGGTLDFVRPSKPQQRMLVHQSVAGTLRIESNPGPLWPLLVASSWLHIVKGTTSGLGHVVLAS